MKKVLLVAISVFLFNSSFAQWAALGTGLESNVRALCVHGGSLYAGGDFSGLVRKWNGTNWVAVGSGLTGTKVYALISYNNELYAGGTFSVPGATVTYNVAKFNGSSWVAVGNGLGPNTFYVLCFYNWNGTLYAGGTFTVSGTSSVSKIAKLVGGSWQQVGGGAPTNCLSGVHTISSLGGVLYVGGQGSAPCMNKLDGQGTGWLNLPSTLTNIIGVYSLYPFAYPNLSTPCLFVGGDFQQPTNCICSYNPQTNTFDQSINNFSGGNADQVNAIIASPVLSSNAYLYAGGIFTVTGLHATANLAKKKVTLPWDSTTANFTGGGISALCFYNGKLVAGGSFTSAGVAGTNHIAQESIGTIGIDEFSENVIVNNIYPNPVISEALLKIQTTNSMQQPELKMLDLNGKEIMAHTTRISLNRTQNEVEFKLNCLGLSAGIYYYMVVDEERTIATGKVVVE